MVQHTCDLTLVTWAKMAKKPEIFNFRRLAAGGKLAAATLEISIESNGGWSLATSYGRHSRWTNWYSDVGGVEIGIWKNRRNMALHLSHLHQDHTWKRLRTIWKMGFVHPADSSHNAEPSCEVGFCGRIRSAKQISGG